MSEPTPVPGRYRRELKTWSKNELVREVERLRAFTREHARRPGEDTTRLPGSIVDVAGDPHARGGALVDARNAILLDEVDVCLVDPNPSEPEEHGRVALTLAGRVNMRDERSSVLLMFNADGAAAKSVTSRPIQALTEVMSVHAVAAQDVRPAPGPRSSSSNGAGSRRRPAAATWMDGPGMSSPRPGPARRHPRDSRRVDHPRDEPTGPSHPR